MSDKAVDLDVSCIKKVFVAKFSGWSDSWSSLKVYNYLEKCVCGADKIGADLIYDDPAVNRTHEGKFVFCTNLECEVVNHSDSSTDSDELFHERSGESSEIAKSDETLSVSLMELPWFKELVDKMIEKKIGKGKINNANVTIKLLSEKCVCFAPIICVFEKEDSASYLNSISTHMCLGPECDKTLTFSVGTGSVMGDVNADIHECHFCKVEKDSAKV